MTPEQIDEVVRQLRDSNESTRLKAANLLTKPQGPEARAAVAALRDMFLADPNPAARFLAKRALTNLGENVDQLASEGKGAAGPAADAGDGEPGPRDAGLLWRVAADLLRPLIPSLFRLLESNDERVLDQVSEAVERLGTVLCAAPLLEAFERETTRALAVEGSEGTLASYDDVKGLLHIAKLKHSGINPATAAAMGNLRCPEVLEALIDMLRSDNVALRNNAVRILSELSDPNTIEPLLRLLGSDNPRLEAKVIKTVSKIVRESQENKELVVRAVMGHFRPTESEFKLYSIVEALGRIAHPGTLPFLMECLRHQLPRVRANAIEAIARIGVPEDDLIRLVSPLLMDENNRVLANSVAALWPTKARDRARAVMDMCLAATDKWYRASIAFTLGQIDSPDSVGPLVDLMKDADSDVRRNAVNALGRLKAKAAIAKLVEHVNDDDIEVRIKVIEQIGKSGIVAYNDVLHLMMIDAESFPRLLATIVLALGRMRLVENIPTISYYLNDKDERIRANAVEALEAINDQKVMKLLDLAISDNHPRVRANAIKALWRFGELGTIQVVRKMIEAPMADQQASGAYALGDMASAARDRATMADYPLLVAALRRAPRYQELAAQSF
ncbi:MAG: HEAT repeat domain-containing protein [Candidatus Wallbacteria bacterium]|nr:HEAT repeat domain-containing protein [Candidatus Wallbacteria bacterium]